MNNETYHPNRDDYNLILILQIEEKINELNDLKNLLKESVNKVLL